jgi:hypothetical protein
MPLMIFGGSMTPAPQAEASAVLAQALECLSAGTVVPLVGAHSAAWSERCVEVPWIAGQLGVVSRLLDVGWSMSPPEWLGVLLAVVDRGTSLTGIDIIDPRRVRTRYPADLVDRVLATPVRVESILDAQPSEGLYDAVTCVSTLEHIGFDVAAPASDRSTAFVRASSPDEAITVRDPETDRLFLDAVARLLTPGGSLLLSVPAGKGVPILHQDSLGLFTHQYEYDELAWRAITSDPRFSIQREAFFTHDESLGWQEVSEFSALTHQTSAMRPFATGCAMVHLTLN